MLEAFLFLPFCFKYVRMELNGPQSAMVMHDQGPILSVSSVLEDELHIRPHHIGTIIAELDHAGQLEDVIHF